MTFDENRLYQKVMGYVKELQQNCSVPAGFIDFILMWNGFKASIETEHFVDAKNFWKMLFDKDIVMDTGFMPVYGNKICGCHG